MGSSLLDASLLGCAMCMLSLGAMIYNAIENMVQNM